MQGAGVKASLEAGIRGYLEMLASWVGEANARPTAKPWPFSRQWSRRSSRGPSTTSAERCPHGRRQWRASRGDPSARSRPPLAGTAPTAARHCRAHSGLLRCQSMPSSIEGRERNTHLSGRSETLPFGSVVFPLGRMPRLTIRSKTHHSPIDVPIKLPLRRATMSNVDCTSRSICSRRAMNQFLAPG